MIYNILIIFAIFALVVLFVYTPAIVQYFVWKKSEREFQEQLALLDNSDFYDNCRIVVTKPIGTCAEPSSDLRFADVHKNQQFAMNSIMQLI